MARRNLFLAAAMLIALLPVARAAEPAPELLKQAQELFRPLPQDRAIIADPITKERVALGQMLFFDPRLTVDGNLSCANCHQPARYGTDGLATAIGVRNRPHPRNAPTILNSGLSPIIHWRGDRETLEDQVIKAVTSPITSGQPDEAAVIERLRQIPGYGDLFKAAFPDDPQPLTGQNIAAAISVYERSLTTPSAFDRYLAGDRDALSPKALSGLEAFINTGCAACHNGVHVGGTMYRKFGIVEDYWKATGSRVIDKGRADVTNNPDDLYVFRVASLRNVAMTAPYFHDGSVKTLPEAVKVMARIQIGATLSDAETGEIAAFLESLTGDLPKNFAAPESLPPGSISVGR